MNEGDGMKEHTGLRSLFLTGLVLSLFAATAAVGAEDDWPREIQIDKGLVVMYQPQVDRLEGNDLHSRAAVSVTPDGKSEPVFGAAWLEARLDTDLDIRIAEFREVRVPRVRFPEATPEQEQELAELLTAEIPRWDIELSLDSLQAMLEIAEKQNLAAENFNDSPPRILFTDEPSVLVSIDSRQERPDHHRRPGAACQITVCLHFHDGRVLRLDPTAEPGLTADPGGDAGGWHRRRELPHGTPYGRFMAWTARLLRGPDRGPAGARCRNHDRALRPLPGRLAACYG
jgi:hypothetical protein